MRRLHKRFGLGLCVFWLAAALSAVPTAELHAAAETSLKLTAPPGRPGDEIEAAVYLENNPGVAGFSLRLNYDVTVLTALEVTKDDLSDGEVFVSNVNAKEGGTELPYITAVWASGADNANEELFRISFRINEAADAGSVPVDIAIEDLINAELEEVTAATSGGAIDTAPKPLWGDANGDGNVDAADMVRIARYLARIEPEGGELLETELADVNRDGELDAADLVIMAQYLADPAGHTLGESAEEDKY